jgi:hypothetical protein
MNMRIKILLAALILVSFTNPVTHNYPAIFGSNYQWANKWLFANSSLFDKMAQANKVPSKELKAIVFPELIRYNAVYDALEIASLKFLYISRGKDYADFSVGYFQMKPSFAEKIEADALTYLTKEDLLLLGLSNNDLKDDENSRSGRIKRITSKAGQLNYLAAFYKICKAKFGGVSFKSAEESVRFFATCYNAGYHFTEVQVKANSIKSFYQVDKILKSDAYCYADISAYWHSQL